MAAAGAPNAARQRTMTTYTVPKPEPPTPAPAAAVSAMPHEAESGAPSAAWILYLGLWSVLILVGFLAIKCGVSWTLIALFMAPLTLIGTAWRPVFGLALVFLILPIGNAFTIGGAVTADRAVGIMFGLGAVINILATRKPFRFLVLPTLALIALAAVGWLSLFWAEHPPLVIPYAFTYTQMFLYILVAIPFCQKEEGFRWPLLAYVGGCMLAVMVPRLTGTVMEVSERVTFRVEGTGAVDANFYGALLGLGFLSAVYRYSRETSRPLRLIYIAAFIVLPLGVILTGSRGAVFGLAATLILSFILLPWVLRRIRIIAGAVALIGLLAVSVYVTGKYFLTEKTAWRLVSPEYAAESYSERLFYITEAIAYVSRHPFGAGLGCFRTSYGTVVHNDLFFLLSELGFLGAAIFAVFATAMVLSVWRMPNNLSKWYASSIVIFQLLTGLTRNYVLAKHFWLFILVAWLLSTLHRHSAIPTTFPPIEPTLLNHPLTGPSQQPLRPTQNRWSS